jgi:branched-chain amino acid transport system substrate-binding protein
MVITGTKRFWILPIIAVSLVFHSCSKPPAPMPEIRIGATAYVNTDGSRTEGLLTERVALLAAREINETGGLEVAGVKHKVVVVFEGYIDSPENAVHVVKRLINQENVVAIVGPQASRNAIPAGAIAEASHVPMICPLSTNPKTTQGRKYVFRMSFLDDFQGRAMAHFAYRELGKKRGAVLYDIANPYSLNNAKLFKEFFEQAGGEIVSFQSYITSEKDFSHHLENVRSQRAEVLFLPNRTIDAHPQAEQAYRTIPDVILLGADSWDRTIFKDLPEFDGTYTVAHWAPGHTSEKAQAFVKAYRSAYDELSTDTPALTYDAFKLLFRAIQSAGSIEPESIQRSLYELGPYEGVTGTTDFIDSGDPVKSITIIKFEDGEVLFHKSIIL